MDKILVWIPMYNCGNQICRVLDQLCGKFEEILYEVLVIDNQSIDNGVDIVLDWIKKNSLKSKVKLLKNEENYGLGGSHKVAFQYAIENGFDYIITLHGDDQGSIVDLLPFIESGEYKRYDCLLGSRFMKNSKLEGYSKFRTIGNIIYNWLFSLVTLKRIYDLGAGLNMYNVNMLKDRYYFKFADDLTINYYQVLVLGYYKHKYKFFPLVWREDDQISNVKLFRQAIKTIGIVLKFTFKKRAFINGEHRDIVRNEYKTIQIYP